MPKLGTYEYPEFTLSETVALGQRIAREFTGEVSRHGLASALGMSERGGAFSSRLGALRVWGVATGRSRIRVTRDGMRAATPLSPQEAEAARKTLAALVPLFAELAARSGAAPLDHSRLAILLEDITGANRQEILARLSIIDRVFSDARPYLSDATRPTEPSATTAPSAHAPPGAGTTTMYSTSAASDSTGREIGATTAPSGTNQPDSSIRTIAGEPAARFAQSNFTGVVLAEPRPGRIELILPEGTLSLPETVTNIDAALTVLWAYRQRVAERDAREGNTTLTAGAPHFVLRWETPPVKPVQ
ncbi:MAG: hypothetical protein EXR44_00535 [Dehalococcoidia bacterium]|nr:hypothetical protein [Dehalococcoidia bacterium]